MGGEWIFRIKVECPSYDLSPYHAELRKFKNACEEYKAFDVDSVEWAANEVVAADTNVFAVFKYQGCSRHSFHGPTGPQWKLYWNPLTIQGRERSSDTHARCSPPYIFISNSTKFQRKLSHLFPNLFELTLEDGLSGYNCDYEAPDPREEDESYIISTTRPATSRRGYDIDESYSASRTRPAASRRGYDVESDRESDEDFNDVWEQEEEFTPHSGYYISGSGDHVYAFAGEGPDHTACDSECGYCGRCMY